MSKNHWEILKVTEDTRPKKLECPLPSAKDLEEETEKKLKQIFKNLNDENKKKELVERVKKSWEVVDEIKTVGYLIPPKSPKRLSRKDGLKKDNFIKQCSIDGCKDDKTLVYSKKVVESKVVQNNFPIGLVISGGALVIVGLTSFLVIKNKKKKR